jgi:hypothetical protein
MRRIITDEEFWQQLAGFEHSAWRWEQQPAYYIGYEHEQFDKFLAGEPEPPTANRELGEWMAQVSRQVSEGKTVGRVRVVQTPLTDYQRWMRWMDRWNRKAGENIQYLTRQAAEIAGIIPQVGPHDWWLFDDQRLMVMHHDEQGMPVRYELFDDEPEVEQAIRWRTLAVDAATREADAAEAMSA